MSVRETRTCAFRATHLAIDASRPSARQAVSGRFAFHGSPDEWGLPPIVAPATARGRECESRPQVPHPAPSLRARADAPRWTRQSMRTYHERHVKGKISPLV